MIAVLDSCALATMTDSGMSPDDARATLATMKPAARYDGRAYYAPRAIDAALRRKGFRP